MALSREPLPEEVFEAVATSPEEAEALAYRDRKGRRMISLRSSLGW